MRGQKPQTPDAPGASQWEHQAAKGAQALSLHFRGFSQPSSEKCHTPENHQKDGILDKLRKACKQKEYREPTFMNILRRRLWKAFPAAAFTYGNITNADRKRLGLRKTHANDAIAIALRGTDYRSVINDGRVTYIRQVRDKKRSLHEATPRKGRSTPNRMAVRANKNVASVKGFGLHDKIRTRSGRVGYISGFTGTSAYVQSFDGKYIMPAGKKYKQHALSSLTKLLGRNNNWISQYGIHPTV